MTRTAHPIAAVLAAAVVFTLWLPTVAAPAGPSAPIASVTVL